MHAVVASCKKISFFVNCGPFLQENPSIFLNVALSFFMLVATLTLLKNKKISNNDSP